MDIDTELEIREKINDIKAILYLHKDLPIEMRQLYESKIETWEAEIAFLKYFNM